MKTLMCVMLCFGLFSSSSTFSQSTKSKQKQRTKTSKSPAVKDDVKLDIYSYPFYALVNNNTSTYAGCFIAYKGMSFFVTSRHNFYTTTSERKRINNVMIFIDQSNLKNSAKVLSLNMQDQRILPVCFENDCTDIVLLPVTIPRELAVNYVQLDAKQDLEGKDMAIVGYLKDSLNIVKTRFDSFLPRDSTYFLTEKSSPKDVSGAPVLVYSRNKSIINVRLAGVYSGKEISQEYFDKGLIAKASLITHFLNSKTKKELMGEEK